MFPVGKSVLIIIVAILIDKVMFKPNYNYLKFMVQNCNYLCTKTKFMASGPITSWEIDGETVETVSDLIFFGLQNHCRW